MTETETATTIITTRRPIRLLQTILQAQPTPVSRRIQCNQLKIQALHPTRLPLPLRRTSAAGLLCPAIFNCVNTEMQKICPPTGATQECQNQAISTCAGMADTPQEAQWFQASLNCQITCLQQNGGYNAGAFECMRSTCVKAQADCYSAGVYGAGGCADIDSCSQGCQLDSTFSCVRACFQGSTEQASLDYHDINLCAQASCVDSINTPQFEPCAQAAVGQGGACSAEVAICIGANTP